MSNLDGIRPITAETEAELKKLGMSDAEIAELKKQGGIETIVTVGRRSPMSRVNELLDEKVRLGNLDSMGVLDTNEYKKRMLEIDLQIEELERDTDPFDMLFPFQTKAMKDGGEAKFDAEKSDLDKDGKISDYERARGTAIARNMNQGGEIDMALADVSRGTMDMEAPQMQPSQQEMAAVQQIMDMVMQMMQSGASEEEIIAALKEMGLSDQDIAMIMQAIVEQGQQANPIDAELSQMM